MSRWSAENATKAFLGALKNDYKGVIGYKGADFVLIDCDINDPKEVYQAAKKGSEPGHGGLVVGCNALHRGYWQSDHELKAHFLPTGEGLLVTRTGKKHGGGGNRRSSHWVVKVDKCALGRNMCLGSEIHKGNGLKLRGFVFKFSKTTLIWSPL